MKTYIVRMTHRKTQEVVVRANSAEEAKARAIANSKPSGSRDTYCAQR